MAFGLVPIAHIAAAVLSIIELGLTAYLASLFSGFWYSAPSVINFMVFNSVWSLLVLAYVGLTPLYYTRAFHKLVSVALLAVTTLFWFAGSIALAVAIGVPVCHDASCGSAQAAVAFGFFIWVIFTFLLVLDSLEALRSRGHATTTHTKHTTGTTYPGV